MTAERIVKQTKAAVDHWASGLSKVAQTHLSCHDRKGLHAAIQHALAEDGIQREPEPKGGDRVRWIETDEEVVLTRVEDGKAFGPWSEGEGKPESFVPAAEVRVVEPGLAEGWSWLTEAPGWWASCRWDRWVCGATITYPDDEDDEDAAVTIWACYSSVQGGWLVTTGANSEGDLSSTSGANASICMAVVERGRALLAAEPTP